MVRLELLFVPSKYSFRLYFNSLMVRLEYGFIFANFDGEPVFQFLNGAIGVVCEAIRTRRQVLFQFLNGAIGVPNIERYLGLPPGISIP